MALIRSGNTKSFNMYSPGHGCVLNSEGGLFSDDVNFVSGYTGTSLSAQACVEMLINTKGYSSVSVSNFADTCAIGFKSDGTASKVFNVHASGSYTSRTIPVTNVDYVVIAGVASGSSVVSIS